MKSILQSAGKLCPSVVSRALHLLCRSSLRLVRWVWEPPPRQQALVASFFCLVSFSGCVTGPNARFIRENPVELADQLDAEVSLKEDRSNLKEIRKNIPESTRNQNDELAMDLELMGIAGAEPSRIRSQFQSQVRKLRTRFREKSQDLRKEFRETQGEQRDRFLDYLKQQREAFKKKDNVDREQTKRFFDKQNVLRKDFFAEQKDQRKEFDSIMREKSKDFHANMKERVRQFNEQLRLYTRSHRERERAEKEAKRRSKDSQAESSKRVDFQPDPRLEKETQKIIEEFQEMKSKPSDPLKSQ